MVMKFMNKFMCTNHGICAQTHEYVHKLENFSSCFPTNSTIRLFRNSKSSDQIWQIIYFFECVKSMFRTLWAQFGVKSKIHFRKIKI